MKDLFKAFLFKLRHDIAFKIVLIIGIGLAILLTLIYLLVDLIAFKQLGVTLNGLSMLSGSFSPTQNFGLAIPVNLLTFTVMEFSQGAIRNKIIAGHSKAKIYTSIFLNGIVFAFILITVYSLLCFGLGSAIGGVNPKPFTSGGAVDPSISSAGLGVQILGSYIWKLIIIALVSYLSIVSFAVLIATIFRSIGSSIPVVMVVIVFAAIAPSMLAIPGISKTFVDVIRIVDPLYAIGAFETVETDGQIYRTLTNFTFISGILNNLIYAILFYAIGLVLFKRRDIK